MRHLLVMIDGLADTPLAELGGKTPLEHATTPVLDKLSAAGEIGTVRTIRKGEEAETLSALFTVLGYPPGPYRTGRGYYEALATGQVLAEGEWAFRLQLVNVQNGKLADSRAGGLSDIEGSQLVMALSKHFNLPRLRFVPVAGHNHLLIIDGIDFHGLRDVSAINLINQPLAEQMPQGPGQELLSKIIDEAPAVLAKHEVNRARVAKGKLAANAVWIWGGGTTIEVPGFHKTFGIKGAMVSYSNLFRGVGVATGLAVPNPGGTATTGLSDPSGRMVKVDIETLKKRDHETDEINKLRVTTESALQNFEFVLAHFSYPDDHSHQGDVLGKVKAIGLIDKHFFKPVLKVLETQKDTRLLVISTLMSRVETRMHDERAVPYLMWGPGIEPNAGKLTFTESNAETARKHIEDGTRLIDNLLHGI
ncbi:MAG: hypothetical protein IT462_06675 [Planctomycetes bacterium]|nr:hypothetical protein [Planctomycetota bacterium]